MDCFVTLWNFTVRKLIQFVNPAIKKLSFLVQFCELCCRSWRRWHSLVLLMLLLLLLLRRLMLMNESPSRCRLWKSAVMVGSDVPASFLPISDVFYIPVCFSYRSTTARWLDCGIPSWQVIHVLSLMSHWWWQDGHAVVRNRMQPTFSLQCSDTVGWVTGRASGL